MVGVTAHQTAAASAFLPMAGWMRHPDKIDGEASGGKRRFGVLGTTVGAFFLAEMCDKR
jgi:putative Ca2+/H+ antiporter (TMEM165/GDT1 family)